MIRPLSLTQVAQFIATQVVPNSLSITLHNGDAEFTQVNTDTRTLAVGELFIALRGEQFDGHDFLTQAAKKNPCGIVTEVYDPQISLPQLVVSDTLIALGQIAALNRNLFTGALLAITGSNGKTTVKTLVASILSEVGPTLATKGNLNNHIGVPFTLLQLNESHRFAVIEMGASAIGEIAYLCTLARPKVAMVNNVMPAHLEGFGSLEGVAQAKGEIYANLAQDGIAVINTDEKFVTKWLTNLATQHILRVSLHDPQANCYARNIQQQAEDISFELVINDQAIPIDLYAQGEHSVRNALMAAACAYAVGATLAQIQLGLKKFAPVAGRMSRHIGLGGATVIDDSYNANPGSVRAAIDVLAGQSNSILVLGDLAELGENAAELHAELGRYARIKNIQALFTLGQLSEHAAAAFGSSGKHFSDRSELIAALKTIATAKSTFLIKGSRSSKMDLVVLELCNSAGEPH